MFLYSIVAKVSHIIYLGKKGLVEGIRNSVHLSAWVIVRHRCHQGRIPAQHCRQKQGLAQPLKQKANEDSATTVKYEASVFADRGSFMPERKQIPFVWY